jgi:cell division protein YceG involved in septum cleavage
LSSGNPSQRTAEERARARDERARRRAGRDGEAANTGTGRQVATPSNPSTGSEAANPRIADGEAPAGLAGDGEIAATPAGVGHATATPAGDGEVPAGLAGDGEATAAPAAEGHATATPAGGGQAAGSAGLQAALSAADGAALRSGGEPAAAVAPTARRRRPTRRQTSVLAVVAVIAAGAFALAHALPGSKSAPPPALPAIVRITIPEGETRAQIAQIASAHDLTGSYLTASRHSTQLDPARYGAPRGTPSLEGFLFPATYELYAHQSARRLVALQLQAFEENFGATARVRARALGVTPYRLLIVASMVEREALLPDDRPKVAAVIYNRLHAGMFLGIDSTIRYALHDFSAPLTEAQLHVDSPYNTRTHHGLPPTPISNPGLAAIDAAAHPARVPYLYYVNGADGCGELVFSTTNAEFERHAAAYHEALARNGGRVPACRKR